MDLNQGERGRSAPGEAARVLVVEDDVTINQALADRLRAEGFAVEQVGDGQAAVTKAREWRPDVILLDLMLPGIDGLEVCRRVQAERPTPVLMLTARDDEADVLVGLAVGADDYLTKPFRMREVVARVRALLRRVERACELARTPSPRPGLGGVEIDERTRRVLVDGVEARLTPTEHDLLVFLSTEPGRVYPRDQIMIHVWGWSGGAGTRTLDSHVKTLRAKIGPQRIRTVHGVGYAFEVAP
ncbi:response regulator transcription factor [Arsenicicoccus piscis]|uniref:DNA-binding response regulator n=1 Tax=Arsenicicoccus piscis TaxID=673954 RepID=A0ABQ6HTD8_9MICO|nr:response regulator transcription factor [Arsenicicoccus piscis]GMA21775.1 DNA-binding response regulator [Arsenicicoccus piscis]